MSWIAQYKRLLRPLYRQLISPLKSIRHRGTARHCPVCGKKARAFLIFGFPPREDCMCPFCGALDRHRLLWLYLQQKSSLFKTIPDKILHIAPEAVFEDRFRKLWGRRYTTADLSSPFVDRQMDITDIDSPDNVYSLIICNHVLEHIPDDKRALSELYRVLTEKGNAIIMVPISAEKTIEDPSIIDPDERHKLYGHPEHVRRYGPDFGDRLKKTGFDFQTYSAEDFLDQEEIKQMAILQEAGEVFICRKGGNR